MTKEKQKKRKKSRYGKDSATSLLTTGQMKESLQAARSCSALLNPDQSSRWMLVKAPVNFCVSVSLSDRTFSNHAMGSANLGTIIGGLPRECHAVAGWESIDRHAKYDVRKRFARFAGFFYSIQNVVSIQPTFISILIILCS